MIRVNGRVPNIIHFPDGTIKIETILQENIDTDFAESRHSEGQVKGLAEGRHSEHQDTDLAESSDSEHQDTDFEEGQHFEHQNTGFTESRHSEEQVQGAAEGRHGIRDAVTITWNYEGDAELFAVLALGKHYKNLNQSVILELPYIPNARMDRVQRKEEVFTLKVFCELINQVGFEKVIVMDAHSFVALALLDRVEQVDIRNVIFQAALVKLPKDVVLYFPDEGSQKRYGNLFPEYRHVVGMKKRDWSTGEIQGLEVITNGLSLEGQTVLMIDDIISFGGSFYYSALKLKELGAAHIFAYATHTENSVLDAERGTFLRLLENGTVEKLFTTDSLFTGEHEHIEVVEKLYETIGTSSGSLL